ncbi:hypothetical protein B0H11DRAFT_1954973 [Mycena galericulata]|nr:hypothetical protein B0H11DRAFT_1954973 [Mycena galericulata]
MLLSLLASYLKRSGNHPLKIVISTGGLTACMVLKLLSQHSRRWREVHHRIGSGSTQYLTAAKGNLPALEILTISGNKLSAMDVFEAAPRLKTVTFKRRPTDIPKFPWGQLQTFKYWAGFTCMNPSAGLALMHRLATGTTFTYELHMVRIYPGFHWPSVSSVVETLVLKLDFRDSSPASLNPLSGLFGSLTLPSLRAFTLRQRLVGWDQAGFLSLASHSSFQSSHLLGYLRTNHGGPPPGMPLCAPGIARAEHRGSRVQRPGTPCFDHRYPPAQLDQGRRSIIARSQPRSHLLRFSAPIH